MAIILPRIGFVGVGRMGGNIARCLHERGYPIAAIYRHGPLASQSLAAELGAELSDTLAGVTAAANIVCIAVGDDEAMRSLFANKEDSLLHNAKGKYFLTFSTLSPALLTEFAARADHAGAHALEACMASSIPQAREGTLQLLCAGKREAFDQVRPLLSELSDHGRQLRYVGESGTAAKIKALINLVMNINTAGLAEGLGLGAALGLDPHLLLEVFSQTGAASRVLQTDGEDMVSREHSCFFSAEHAAKDNRIALALARQAGMPLPLAKAAGEQYERLLALGLGHLDKSAIAELTFPNRHLTQPH